MLFLNHRITNKVVVVSVLLIYTSLSVTLVAAQKATKIDTLPSCCMKIPSRFSTNTHDSIHFHLTAEKSINGMVLIPGGAFNMGGDNEQADRDEFPKHKVSVDSFFMDITEVTNAQFKKFVEATGYVTTAERKPDWEELKKSGTAGHA